MNHRVEQNYVTVTLCITLLYCTSDRARCRSSDQVVLADTPLFGLHWMNQWTVLGPSDTILPISNESRRNSRRSAAAYYKRLGTPRVLYEEGRRINILADYKSDIVGRPDYKRCRGTAGLLPCPRYTRATRPPNFIIASLWLPLLVKYCNGHAPSRPVAGMEQAWSIYDI